MRSNSQKERLKKAEKKKKFLKVMRENRKEKDRERERHYKWVNERVEKEEILKGTRKEEKKRKEY